MSTARQQLKRLLAETPGEARVRVERLAGRPPYVLIGSEDLIPRTLAGLRKAGLPVAAVASLEKAPAVVARFKDRATFIVADWNLRSPNRAAQIRLKRLGARRVANWRALYCRYPDAFLPYYHLETPVKILAHKARIRQAFELLRDEISRRAFVSQLGLLLLRRFKTSQSKPLGYQYFPFGLVALPPGQVYFDCGAFIGDTVFAYLLRNPGFGHLVAFEPDPRSFATVKRMIAPWDPSVRKRITLMRAGVSNRAARVKFDASGLPTARVTTKGTAAVRTVTIDEIARTHAPGYIKLDIVGSEKAALLGARRTLVCHRPTLAVCVYHRPYDLWELPLYLDSLGLEYRFDMRIYFEDGNECVLYALPPR